MSNDDQWGRELHDGLHHHMNGLESTMSMTQVKDQARAVRRHRSMAVAAAAVAVAAVIVPTALLAQRDGHRATPAPASQTTSAPDTPSDGVTPGQPAAPGVAYLDDHGKTLVLADGTRVGLSRALDNLSAAGDRFVARGGPGAEGWDTVYIVAADGSLHSTGDQATRIVSNGSGAAYATRSGEVKTVWNDGTVSLGTPEPGQELRVAGLIGQGSCARSEGGCTVFYEGGAHQVGLVDSHGPVDIAAPHAIALAGIVAAPNGYLAASQTSYSDTGSCWQVTDPDQKVLWKTCDYSLYGFSPDGQHILATTPYRDGAGQSELFILNAQNGTLEASFKTPQGGWFMGPAVWESSTTVLTVGHSGKEWTAYRLSVDGTMETVLGPIADTGDGTDVPWRF